MHYFNINSSLSLKKQFVYDIIFKNSSLIRVYHLKSRKRFLIYEKFYEDIVKNLFYIDFSKSREIWYILLIFPI